MLYPTSIEFFIWEPRYNVNLKKLHVGLTILTDRKRRNYNVEIGSLYI